MEKGNSLFMCLIKDETRSKSIIIRSATATYSGALQCLAMQLEEHRRSKGCHISEGGAGIGSSEQEEWHTRKAGGGDAKMRERGKDDQFGTGSDVRKLNTISTRYLIDTISTHYLREGNRNRTWRPPSQRMATRTSTPHRCRNCDQHFICTLIKSWHTNKDNH
jgi:hypothetical protein